MFKLLFVDLFQVNNFYMKFCQHHTLIILIICFTFNSNIFQFKQKCLKTDGESTIVH